MKGYSDSKNKYTEEDIIKMLEFLVDIFVVFEGKVFQQIIGIPMDCAPLLDDIFLYSYDRLGLNAVSATLAILRRPILVAFYDTHGDTEDTFST